MHVTNPKPKSKVDLWRAAYAVQQITMLERALMTGRAFPLDVAFLLARFANAAVGTGENPSGIIREAAVTIPIIWMYAMPAT